MPKIIYRVNERVPKSDILEQPQMPKKERYADTDYVI